MTFHHTVIAHVKEGWRKHHKKLLIGTGVTVLVVGIVVGGSAIYVKAFEGRIYPGVSIGFVDVGGMTQAEASATIQASLNGMLDRGLPLRLTLEEGDEQAVIDLRASGSTDPDFIYDLITLNIDEETNEAFAIGRASGNIIVDTAHALSTIILQPQTHADFVIATDRVKESIGSAFADFEDPGQKTDYEVEIDGDDIAIDVIPGKAGYSVDTEEVIVDMLLEIQTFQLSEIETELIETSVVSVEDAEKLTDNLEGAIESAPYTLTHTSEAQREYAWEISDDDAATWIYPADVNGHVVLEFAAEDMREFLDEIHADVDVKAQNARFQIEGDRVVEFAGSMDGTTLDEDATLEELNAQIGVEDVSLPVSVVLAKPDITTESVNSLGIEEILGVGTSNFSGSPSNRRSNIHHGAEKLNGLLIAPGEEFSLVDALNPFTIEDGWLSELVIKGDEIKPEVGGGACQFGTTLFRAAMNSGLNITARSNHSLVVSYYDDPSNGNPGTDATIYDPAPDFRFINDTGNYILLTTEVIDETSDMIFTLWGTSDGRKGSYTPPVILNWTGYGTPVETETDTLAPGVRKCQAAHAGAITEFDYNVEYADGTTFEHTYTSTYRSLPQTCLVGKAADAPPAETPIEPVPDAEPPIEEPAPTE